MGWRALLLVSGLLAPAAAAAQRVPAGAPAPASATVAGGAAGSVAPARSAAAVLASAVLPGSGQLLQGQSRWVPYLALEVWAWLRYRERRAESRRLAAEFRDRAWAVARRGSPVTERRDSIFEYYETLTEYMSSGVWDAAPSQAGLQPEQDTLTFNGNLWNLARRLYFPGGADYPPGSIEYDNALEYYRSHGIPDRYFWAWGSRLEQESFAELITDSDDAYRQGTTMLGIILANHVASAVDALISARLRAIAAGRAEFRSELVPEARGMSLHAVLRIPL